MAYGPRYLPRCIRCRMLLKHCFCDAIPRIEAATRVVFVMHCREFCKVSNTARLALASLSDTRLVVHGRPGEPTELGSAVDPSHQTYVLFPSEDAQVLSRDEVEADGRPVTLVVPDGTWHQAKRIPKRVPGLSELPRRRLPDGPPARYALRQAALPGQLGTCEAVARALGVLEGEAVQAPLDALFDTMKERVLLTRSGR